ncbi:MAG: hypothetical protein CMG00_04450, partial [Candidatus Marinimicrobia bacterium]|nr:hypothetical protein [Candidatus Neomarinimicrobiota bacterium]
MKQTYLKSIFSIFFITGFLFSQMTLTIDDVEIIDDSFVCEPGVDVGAFNQDCFTILNVFGFSCDDIAGVTPVAEACAESCFDPSNCPEEGTGSLSIYYTYNGSGPFAGFEIPFTGIELETSVGAVVAGGGQSESAGFSISNNSNTVIGFSSNGATLPNGDDLLLTEVYFKNYQGGDICFEVDNQDEFDGTMSDNQGETINVETVCYTVDACTEGFDCNGVCGGDAVDLGCGCGEAGPSGCDNTCGSTLVDLGCGCGEAGPSGCDNTCGSTLVDLGCGCGEAGPSGCDNTCGSTLVDLGCGCGEAAAGDCGCDLSVVEDDCGVCGGDGSSCSGLSFQLEIPNTGISGLFIFSSVQGLEAGDQVGIFDSNGFLSTTCFIPTGEVLVGLGTYPFTTITAIGGSADNCAFGGTALAGFNNGNPIVFKVIRDGVLYDTEFNASLGGSNFGSQFYNIAQITLIEDCDTFVDCAGVCGGTAVEDDCGVCGGDGSDDLGCGCFEPGPSGCD